MRTAVLYYGNFAVTGKATADVKTTGIGRTHSDILSHSRKVGVRGHEVPVTVATTTVGRKSCHCNRESY